MKLKKEWAPIFRAAQKYIRMSVAESPTKAHGCCGAINIACRCGNGSLGIYLQARGALSQMFYVKDRLFWWAIPGDYSDQGARIIALELMALMCDDEMEI